jgi:hypothetical protein
MRRSLPRAPSEINKLARTLATVAGQLSEETKAVVLDEALTAAREIMADGQNELRGVVENRAFRGWGSTGEGGCTDVLVALAPELSGTQLEESLAITQAIELKEFRAQVLKALAPRLTGMQQVEALAAARTIDSLPTRLDVLLSLLAGADPKIRAREIRQCLVSIWNTILAEGTPPALLNYIATAATVVGPGTLATLAQHIVEIRQWRWL